MQLLISFYTDEKQTGFRSVSDQVPVLFESWLLLLSDDQKNISFSGVIQPQNDLNNILITGELISGENAGMTADIKFEDVPDSVISVNAEIKNQSAHTDALTELPFSELSDITLDSVFAQELSDSIISFYTSLLMAMPAVYVEKLINLY